MGEPTKLVLLEKIVEVIKRDQLVKKAKDIGNSLLIEFKKFEKRYPNLVCFNFLLKNFFYKKVEKSARTWYSLFI